jgi:signal transduction histidine kinase
VVRITAISKVPEFPIFALVGLSRSVALRPWYRELIGSVLMMLATVLGAGVITRMLRSNERSMVELGAAKEAAETASAMKTRFLTAASHDLRQPIQAINLFLHSLERTGLSDDQRKIFHHLFMSAHSLGDVLNALLDISKIDAGFVDVHLEVTPANDLLRKIESEMAPMAAARNLEFDVHYLRHDLSLITDPYLLTGILRNVVGNAIKYSEHGGVLIGIRRRGEGAVIQVWDTGIGIAPEHLKHVFEEFFQVGNPERDKTKGLGLGLSIVKRLAGLIDAELRCRSRLGRGTLFEIGLPLAD